MTLAQFVGHWEVVGWWVCGCVFLLFYCCWYSDRLWRFRDAINRCSFVLMSLNVCASKHTSSAYSRSSILSVRVHFIPLWVSFALLNAVSKTMLKRSRDSTQPCLTPFLTGIISLFLFLWMTWQVDLLYSYFIIFTNLFGTPRSVSVCHISVCFRDSKRSVEINEYHIKCWAIFERLFCNYSQCIDLVHTGPVGSEASLLFPQ